jgi:hypothetical protein
MAETTKKVASKVKDVTEPAKEFSGLVKENYLNGLDFTFSLFEQNMKVLNSQVDHYFDLEKEFVTNLSEFYKDFPTELPFTKDLPFAKDLPLDGGIKKVAEQLERYTSYRKEQVASARSITSKFAKDAHSMAQENVEKVFSYWTDYFNSLGA